MSITAQLDLSGCPALARARATSRELLARAAAGLTACQESLGGIETIALGGSLGRLEASADSDFDCLIIGQADASAAVRRAAVTQVHHTLAQLPLKPPKATGIYRQAITASALLDHSGLGSLAEAPAIFGIRMQLLLDAQAVYRPGVLRSLQARIIAWYGTGYLDSDGCKSWTYLLNDLVRYLHSYAAWQQYKFERSADDSWQLRQAKLRTSRLLTMAGLLFLLGESNARADKQTWLFEHIQYTPLERLQLVMRCYDPHAFSELLRCYEQAFALLSTPAVRAELVATGPAAATALSDAPTPYFAAIKQLSRDLLGILTNFILDRRHDWDARFFERLLL